VRRQQRWTQPIAEPEVPAGWLTGPPDLVGVGAQRAGTTWWWRGAIRSHPGFVREAKPGKELHFFDRFWDGREVPEDLAERYARQFPRPPGAITGEWTPRYMHDFWALPLLAQAAPQAKILVMLRDPVERYRSGIARELRLADEDGTPLEIAIVGDAVYRSMYSQQLGRLFQLFGRERVLVLQHERCSTDPLGEMQRTQGFLGLEPLGEMPKLLIREHKPSQDKRELPPYLHDELTWRLRRPSHGGALPGDRPLAVAQRGRLAPLPP
jgi:hypothetical protein